MSEANLLSLKKDQQLMTRQAYRLVLGLTLLIHIGLNAYAMQSDDSFLKIEMPILSGVTFLSLAVYFFLTRKHE